MASSSSAPAPKPTPYEVFLSFRGEDTRNNFVSHLHAALYDRGIRTYFDEKNLQNGQTISVELVRAIQETAIAIVIFSKNYASSIWCLSELLEIVKSNKMIIFPIFYDVDPSDVRWQENTFFEAFSSHEINFPVMVNSWRDALREVANLTGVDIRGKNEASCVKKIVDEILRKLPSKASHFTNALIGRSQIPEIKRVIFSHPNYVLFIGISGMHGVGKTTTARAIFEECKSEFEGSCFLQDVRQRKNEMEKLQKQLLSHVLKSEIVGINDVVEGSNMIRERLCFKRVLLVVDDVDDIQQLNVLAGQWFWFGKGSRIIITTCDNHLLNDVHYKYEVTTLNNNEAMHLFLDHAFKNEHLNENYIKLSHQVLSYAGGLPLALKVLGDHLYRRDELFWRATLRRLEEVPEHTIISKLQISFDRLNSLQQNIFLDIACFFRGTHRDYITQRLRTLCLHPEEGITVLIQKSLIHESLTNSGTIEMHDLLQDMGHHIVRQRARGDVRRYSRLWLDKDIKEVLLYHKESTEAEGILIDSLFYDDAIKYKILNEESFKNMKKLRFLEIYGRGGQEKANVFQSSFQIPRELLWLNWFYYPGKYLVQRFYPSNLVHLEMRGSLIERTPDFMYMPNLEVLDLSYSQKLVDIDQSLGFHMNIKRIDLSFCSALRKFPKIVVMNSLECLDLGYTNLKRFPPVYEDVDSLQELYFNNTYIKGLPESIRYSTGLRKLKLGCKDNVTTELGEMSSFEYLNLFRIEKFSRLTAVPGLPSSLKTLQMVQCPVLTKFPMSFPLLLEYLQITGSKIMRTPDFSHLPFLETLDLSDSFYLVVVDPSLGVHKRIRSICFNGCRNLFTFPPIDDMGYLRVLELCGTSLQCFPEIKGNIDSLVHLNLEGTCIRTLPESIGRATGLERLKIASCKHLVSLPFSLRFCEKLEIHRLPWNHVS